MISHAFLVLLQGVTFLASAATIPADPANQNAGSNSLQLVPSLSNTNLTFGEPDCLDMLGTNLNVASCRNVVGKIPRSTNYITVGWRGSRNFDLILPYIYVSGMYRRLKLALSSHSSSISFLASSTISRINPEALADFPLAPSHLDDGACVIYVLARPTLQPDVVTFTGISESAQRVLQKCVADRSIGSGGVIGELGTFESYFPLVKGGFDSHLLALEPWPVWDRRQSSSPWSTADPANLAEVLNLRGRLTSD